jgi:hypothetical protein
MKNTLNRNRYHITIQTPKMTRLANKKRSVRAFNIDEHQTAAIETNKKKQ